jgi:site-specific DNA recombinase
LTPTYCIKKTKRYRYYVSTALVTGAPSGGSLRRRIPAGDVDAVVINRLRTFVTNRAEILDALGDELENLGPKLRLLERGHQIADQLDAQVPEKVQPIVTALVARVEVRPDCVQIHVSRSRLVASLTGSSFDQPTPDDQPSGSRDDILTLVSAAKLRRVGREMKMLVDGHDKHAAVDPGLLRLIARAHDIQTRLIQDTRLSVHDVASQERVTAAYIYTLLRLPWLAPDITTAIVNGQQPPQLNAKKLMRHASQLPPDWAEQRALFGF